MTFVFIRMSQYLPRGFVRSNGLKEGYCEMVLKNEYGGTWDLVMRHHESNNHTVIRQGWRSFCRANRIKARDPFRFKLVRTGEKPVLRLCSAETNRDTKPGECSKGNDVTSLSTDDSSGEESIETEESEEETSSDDIIVTKENEEESLGLRECLNVDKWKYCLEPGASSSQSQNRFVTLTVTPYSFKCNKLVSCLEVVYSLLHMFFEVCSGQSFCLHQNLLNRGFHYVSRG